MPLMTQYQEEAKGFCCSLTSKIMLDPVKDSQGHVFNRADIEAFLVDTEQCPLTQHALKINQLIPMTELKKTIEKYLNDNPERRSR
ncbi:MAG: hypothetical protein EZS28_034766 [Streblomastix strix]|uniref:U-box domain-containing protein n=1 Tax=Streblomastix strix TaxID=222440 RepID=A0A5J4UGB3_9EUKA|nr:MAG: hypothetical protein EZS28_034766 [Streblomastix strix]